MFANRSHVRNDFTNTKKLVEKLARLEASSICRQQFANVFADCFCSAPAHTNSSCPHKFANFSLPCSLLASVSVRFRSKETPRNGILPARNWGESKIRKRGWGRGRKETLADKPLDFENLRSPANGAHDWLDQSNIIDMCRS